MTDETPQSEGEPSPADARGDPDGGDQAVHLRRRGRQASGDEDDVAPAAPAAERDPGDARRAGRTRGGRSRSGTAPAPTTDRAPGGDLHPEVGGPRRRRDHRRADVRWHRLRDRRLVRSGSTAEREQRVPERHRDATAGSSSPAAASSHGGQLPNGGQLPGNGNGNGDGNGGGSTASNAGFLGVGVQTAATARASRSPTSPSDSPAAKAGLKEGDVITAIDGDDVTSADARALGGPGQGERRRDQRHLHPRRPVEHRRR